MEALLGFLLQPLPESFICSSHSYTAIALATSLRMIKLIEGVGLSDALRVDVPMGANPLRIRLLFGGKSEGKLEVYAGFA
jgi:hypothetical protein